MWRGDINRDIVDEGERFSTHAQHIVDIHRDTINPDRVKLLEFLGDQNLGPNSVR
jgi:hypothetical protein